MKNMRLKKIDPVVLKGFLLSLLVVAAMPSFAESAQASTLKDIAERLVSGSSSQLGPIPGFISAICYIAGAGLTAGGVLKLKEHADKPFDMKMTPGLVRLGAGAAAISLPSLAAWILRSLDLTEGSLKATKGFMIVK